MAEFFVDIVLRSTDARRGLRAIDKELKGVEDSATDVRKAVAGVFAGVGVLRAVRDFSRLSDSYTNIQNRLKSVTEGTQELSEATDQLIGVSVRTRQSLTSTVELYSRVGIAARSLGVQQKELIGFTESVAQAVALSGATAQESAGALRQLSQAIGANRLSGQEFNSVIEQTPVIIDIIAEEIGVTRGEMRALANEGKITGDVIVSAFSNAREELAERFGSTIPTISQSLEILNTRLTDFVGELNKFSGLSGAVTDAIIGTSEAIGFLGDNLQTVADVTTLAAVVVGVRLATSLAGSAKAQAVLSSAVIAGRSALSASNAETRNKAALELEASLATQKQTAATLASTEADLASLKVKSAVAALRKDLALSQLEFTKSLSANEIGSKRVFEAETKFIAASNASTRATKAVEVAQIEVAAAKRANTAATAAATAAQGSLTAATAAGTASARIYASTLSVLRGALSLVGGPIGLIALTATGLVLLNSRSKENTEISKQQSAAIEGLSEATRGLNTQNREQLGNSLALARISTDTLRQRLSDLQQERSEAEKLLNTQRALQSSVPVGFGSPIDPTQIQNTVSLIDNLDIQIKELVKSIKSGDRDTKNISNTISDLNAKVIALKFELPKTTASFQDLISVINPGKIQLKEYELLQGLLNEALERQVDLGISAAEAQERLRNAYADTLNPAGALIDSLNEQQALLIRTSSLTAKQADIEEEVSSLRKKFSDIGAEFNEKEIRLILKKNQALRDEQQLRRGAANSLSAALSFLEEQEQILSTTAGLTSEQAAVEERLFSIRKLSLQAGVEFNEKETRALIEKIELLREERKQKESDEKQERKSFRIQSVGLEDVRDRVEKLNKLDADGLITARQKNEELRKLKILLLETSANQAEIFGEGFSSQFLLQSEQIGNAQDQFTSLGKTVGGIFGPGGTLSSGIGDAVAQSIVFGNSFSDALRNIGRQIISQIIGGITQIGVNLLLQKTLGSAVLQSTTAETVAAMGVITKAAAPAATATSIATVGGAPAAAATSLSAFLPLILGLLGGVAVGAAAFKDGGFVSGPGTSRSDSIPARLSNGEFVINAEATRRNRDLLERINSGQSAFGGASVSQQNQFMIDAKGNSIAEIKRAFNEFMDKESRPGGRLYSIRRSR